MSATTKKTQLDLWQIHGKFYDFDSFVKEHPGGEEMIMLGKGRDCTELFESVHSLSSRRPWELLKRYEIRVSKKTGKKIDDGQSSSDEEGGVEPGTATEIEGEIVPADELFTWTKDGFYGTLTSRVREHIKKELKGNYKSTWGLTIKLIVMFTIYVVCLYNALYSAHRGIYRYLLAATAGIVGEMFQFCIMHDGSHGALSKKYPIINTMGVSVCHWFFWDRWLWLRHHVFAHHCYTGIYRRDPDLTNSKLFLRKHPDSPWKPAYQFQHLYTWFWMMLFPNQHWGQALVYAQSVKKRKVFGVPLHDVNIKPKDYLRIGIYVASFLFHFIGPIFAIGFGPMVLTNFVVWTCIGISYFLVIVPNHDTDDVAKSLISPIAKREGTKEVIKRIDWGEMQVRNSSNHTIGGGLLSTFVTEGWGGMNYQIEHHLFPSMCHVHYSSIAPIVQKTCEEFNIPYNAKKTWLHSVLGYYKLLKGLSKNPKSKTN